MVLAGVIDRFTGQRSRFDPELVSKLRGSSYLEGGYTNTIVRTGDGTIVKFFRRNPLTAFYYSLFELFFSHRLHYHHRACRMAHEITVSRALQGSGITPPTILHEGNIGVEMSVVPGTTLKEYLDQHSPEEAQELGTRLGQVLADLYDEGICLRDCQLQNFQIDDDGTLYSIDHEYATLEPQRGDHSYTVATLLSSARHLDHTTYTAFRDGFLEAYRPAHADRPPIRLLRDLVIGLIAIHQGSAREGDWLQAQRAIYNSARDLSATLKSIVYG